MTESLLAVCRKDFHSLLLAGILHIDNKGIPSIADSSNTTSKVIAKGIVGHLGAETRGVRGAGQRSGNEFEDYVKEFLICSFLKLQHLRCGKFEVTKIGGRSDLALAEYAQYAHLRLIDHVVKQHPELKDSFGADYTVAPDVVISRAPEEDDFINRSKNIVDDVFGRYTAIRLRNNNLPILHASVSCKWTIRSDRAQNARAEALNLVRNRKGPVPHIAVVTAEPLPTRLASLASGTGDIDCVYHFALTELMEAVHAVENKRSRENQTSVLDKLVNTSRLKDISDLPLDLAM